MVVHNLAFRCDNGPNGFQTIALRIVLHIQVEGTHSRIGIDTQGAKFQLIAKEHGKVNASFGHIIVAVPGSDRKSMCTFFQILKGQVASPRWNVPANDEYRLFNENASFQFPSRAPIRSCPMPLPTALMPFSSKRRTSPAGSAPNAAGHKIGVAHEDLHRGARHVHRRIGINTANPHTEIAAEASVESVCA